MGDKTLKERMSVMETKVSRIEIIESDVKEILENHLPHIRQDLALSRQKLAILVGTASAIAVKLLDLMFR